ncbi:hypothetical protein C5E45_33130 [Nocardia nova]|uniref:Uncharacterized protein n=1 Tax=Nocardia nova TaxID=37330 RepID=A0A2S6ACN0_9NOCA|nr:hypothetical protein [Nocardia nova]PPJ19693.1 hypothetical protein C5E41_30870 [Nocardia nova]PPJ31836.1 hypothetical protein C5E45_33130 [Nocardia nova]
MAGGMQYKFGEVDTHTLTFDNIVKNIQENNGALDSLAKGLQSSFTGEAGDQGWGPKIHELLNKITDYNNALHALNATVKKHCASGGAMQDTDKQQGGRFMALEI